MTVMEISLSKIGTLVQGNIIGDAAIMINGAAPFELAGKNQITVAGTTKYLKNIGDCAATAIIVPRDFKTEELNLLQVDNPMVAFAKIMQYFHPPIQPPAGIHPGAVVGADFK